MQPWQADLQNFPPSISSFLLSIVQSFPFFSAFPFPVSLVLLPVRGDDNGVYDNDTVKDYNDGDVIFYLLPSQIQKKTKIDVGDDDYLV